MSDEEIIKACRAVGLHHFIKTLPQGYDTVLTDQVNMSQGQKQQLTIARAMIANKPMLILERRLIVIADQTSFHAHSTVKSNIKASAALNSTLSAFQISRIVTSTDIKE